MKIILTGGTILKEYDVDLGILESKHGSSLDDFLEDMMLCNGPDIVPWYGMKDSLKITLKDREDIWKLCKKQKDKRILVIHGTDTMSETHKYFCEQPTIGTVVFTGAFYPLCVRNTEAEFNIGFALACTKTLPEGNYVAMNGEIFVKDVWKNHEDLCFEGKTI